MASICEEQEQALAEGSRPENSGAEAMAHAYRAAASAMLMLVLLLGAAGCRDRDQITGARPSGGPPENTDPPGSQSSLDVVSAYPADGQQNETRDARREVPEDFVEQRDTTDAKTKLPEDFVELKLVVASSPQPGSVDPDLHADGSPISVATPEPAAAVLLVMSALAVLRLIRRRVIPTR